MTKRFWAAALVTMLTVSAACKKAAEPGKGGQPANAHYEIAIETGDSMKIASAPVDVSVREAGRPVSDAEVQLEMRMPATPQMGEMRTGADLKPAGDGHYKGQLDLGMGGKWTAIVRVKRGGQLVATYTQPVNGVE